MGNFTALPAGFRHQSFFQKELRHLRTRCTGSLSTRDCAQHAEARGSEGTSDDDGKGRGAGLRPAASERFKKLPLSCTADELRASEQRGRVAKSPAPATEQEFALSTKHRNQRARPQRRRQAGIYFTAYAAVRSRASAGQLGPVGQRLCGLSQPRPSVLTHPLRTALPLSLCSGRAWRSFHGSGPVHQAAVYGDGQVVVSLGTEGPVPTGTRSLSRKFLPTQQCALATLTPPICSASGGEARRSSQ